MNAPVSDYALIYILSFRYCLIILKKISLYFLLSTLIKL